MRFKNRYLLLELVWKDSRRDDLLLEPALLTRFREALAACFGDLAQAWRCSRCRSSTTTRSRASASCAAAASSTGRRALCCSVRA